MNGWKIANERCKLLAILVLGAMSLAGCKTATMAYKEMPPDQQLTSIQNHLVALKYLDRTAVGAFNPATKAAIESFQRDHGMQVDGALSPSLYVQSGLALNRMRVAAAQPAKAVASPATSSVKPTLTATSVGERQRGGPEACRFAQWEGTVTNVVDLFACDEGRAIASLSAGRKLAIQIHSVQFSGGKLKVMWREQLSSHRATADNMQKQFSWDQWMKATQSASIYTFVCIMDSGRAAGMRKGTNVEVQAKLLTWSNPNGELACQ